MNTARWKVSQEASESLHWGNTLKSLAQWPSDPEVSCLSHSAQHQQWQPKASSHFCHAESRKQHHQNPWHLHRQLSQMADPGDPTENWRSVHQWYRQRLWLVPLLPQRIDTADHGSAPRLEPQSLDQMRHRRYQQCARPVDDSTQGNDRVEPPQTDQMSRH